MVISCFIMTIKGNYDDIFLCLHKPLRQNGNGSFYFGFIPLFPILVENSLYKLS